MNSHEYDDDGVCIVCGFDGAEWHWWKKQTYEGKASNAVRPVCIERNDDASQE
jgi:hypothetical protein